MIILWNGLSSSIIVLTLLLSSQKASVSPLRCPGREEPDEVHDIPIWCARDQRARSLLRRSAGGRKRGRAHGKREQARGRGS